MHKSRETHTSGASLVSVAYSKLSVLVLYRKWDASPSQGYLWYIPGTHVYVVVQFYPWFNFYFPLFFVCK